MIREVLRIAFISCHFPPDSIGGGQIQSHRLCEVLGLQHRVTAFVRDYSGKKPREERVGHYVLHRRRVSGIPIIRSAIDLVSGVRYIKSARYDTDIFVSFHMQLAALMTVIARLFYGVSSAISPRGAEDYRFNGLKRPFQKFLYRNASAILVQSASIRNEFFAHARRVFSERQFAAIERKTYVFPNVIQESGSHRQRELPAVPALIFVGRLAPIKGLKYLLESLREKKGQYSLKIVGDGPERGHLEALSRGIPVEFTGAVPFHIVSELLVQADIFVLPSLSENLPNVVLEALQVGLPVIATRVGALPEIIKDGGNGYLVDPENAAQIADRLALLSSSQEIYRKMSEAARLSVGEFLPESLLPLYERQLHAIIQSAHTS